MKITLVEGAPTKQFEKDIDTEMDIHLKHFEKELLKVRTGRAHPSMVEDIKVASYGAYMPLKELAACSAPDAALLVVQPWDKANMAEIEKALSASDLGLTPMNDGNIIRIQLPKMSSSRREELAKVLNQKLEACKVSIRNVRKALKIMHVAYKNRCKKSLINSLQQVIQSPSRRKLK
jgi:ribosome recycling factor